MAEHRLGSRVVVRSSTSQEYQETAEENEAGSVARPRTTNKVSEARRNRFRRGRGPGTVESQSEIQSELNRFESAFDRFEKEGEEEERWHVVSIAGAKREES